MIAIRASIILAAAGVAWSGHAARPAPSPQAAHAAFRACVQSRFGADAFAGTVLVAEHGRVLWQSGYGLADPATGVPNQPETRFNTASVGKMFTAVAIGQLVDAGKLRFDDPIGRHLKGVPPALAGITLDQLLTHRSGLGNYLRPENRAAILSARTATDLLPIALAEGLAFAPGTQSAYSNSGFVVLGAVIEAVSGEAFTDYFRRHVFGPAGMTATSTDGAAVRAASLTRMSPGGQPGTGPGTGPRRPAPAIGSPRASPAGNVTSTARDLFRFAEALRTHKLTRRATTEMLWRPHSPGAPRPGAVERTSYGYGFNRVDIGATRILGHGGGAPGANAHLEIYPEAGRVVVALSNYDPPAATDIVKAARRAFAGAARDRVCEAEPPPARQPR